MGVIVPRYDGQTAFRLQHVGSRRIVNDDSIFHVSSDLGHILDKYSVDEGAVLTEQSDRRVTFRIHHIHQRVRVLRRKTRVLDRGADSYDLPLRDWR